MILRSASVEPDHCQDIDSLRLLLHLGLPTLPGRSEPYRLYRLQTDIRDDSLTHDSPLTHSACLRDGLHTAAIGLTSVSTGSQADPDFYHETWRSQPRTASGRTRDHFFGFWDIARLSQCPTKTPSRAMLATPILHSNNYCHWNSSSRRATSTLPHGGINGYISSVCEYFLPRRVATCRRHKIYHRTRHLLLPANVYGEISMPTKI